MKSVYIVLCKREPVAAAYDKENAIKLACSLNQTDAFDENKYIKEVPIIDDMQFFDVNDLISTAIISTQKAYEPYLRTVEQPVQDIEA